MVGSAGNNRAASPAEPERSSGYELGLLPKEEWLVPQKTSTQTEEVLQFSELLDIATTKGRATHRSAPPAPRLSAGRTRITCHATAQLRPGDGATDRSFNAIPSSVTPLDLSLNRTTILPDNHVVRLESPTDQQYRPYRRTVSPPELLCLLLGKRCLHPVSGTNRHWKSNSLAPYGRMPISNVCYSSMVVSKTFLHPSSVVMW